MGKCDCPCCQVYGPIPRSDKLTLAECKAIHKEAVESIKRFKREDPKGYQELVDALKEASNQSNPGELS